MVVYKPCLRYTNAPLAQVHESGRHQARAALGQSCSLHHANKKPNISAALRHPHQLCSSLEHSLSCRRAWRSPCACLSHPPISCDTLSCAFFKSSSANAPGCILLRALRQGHVWASISRLGRHESSHRRQRPRCVPALQPPGALPPRCAILCMAQALQREQGQVATPSPRPSSTCRAVLPAPG